MGCGQSHSGNSNGCAGHIYGSPQGDGDGVGISVQTELFAERHINRNVGGRAPGEEGGDKALL